MFKFYIISQVNLLFVVCGCFLFYFIFLLRKSIDMDFIFLFNCEIYNVFKIDIHTPRSILFF